MKLLIIQTDEKGIQEFAVREWDRNEILKFFTERPYILNIDDYSVSTGVEVCWVSRRGRKEE